MTPGFKGLMRQVFKSFPCGTPSWLRVIPSHRMSMPFGWCQIILLCDR